MIDCSKKVIVERLTPSDEHYFFGYYDITPESSDGKKIVACHAPFIDRMPSVEDELEIGYFNVGDDDFHCIGTTTAWNFQEGCRLQWLSNNEIIFNCRTPNGFGSVIFDVEKEKIIRVFNNPVYSVSKNKKVATSYGFVNNKYNYAHTIDDERNNVNGDGVYILDLVSGEYRLLIPISKLIEMAGSQGYRNWVEYCTFNSEGDLFYVYHRWENEKGLAGNQLCVCDLNGSITTLLISKFISHAGWKGNAEITSWCRLQSSINVIQNNRILINSGVFDFAKKIYHLVIKKPSLRQKFTNDAYVTFKINGEERNKIANRELTSDGHCSWSKDMRFMLTDTYPDLNKERNLLLFDDKQNRLLLLGSFYSYPKGIEKSNPQWNISGLRCDLHPKWGTSERYVYFDSVHEGYRALYRIDITKLRLKEKDE